MKTLEVFTAPSCPYCVRAKELLKRRGIPFTETALGWEDEAAWNDLIERSGGMKTVPQIYLGEKLLGGYTELAALDQSGELAKLVK